MATPTYQDGSNIDLIANFTSDGTTAVNPTSVSLIIQNPDKTVTTVAAGSPSITNPSTGQFVYNLALSQIGTYSWRWTGSSGTNVIVLAAQLISKQDPKFP